MELFTVLILLLAYNIVANRFVPTKHDLWFSILVTIFVVWMAIEAFDLSLTSLGLSLSHVPDGIAVGVIASITVGAVVSGAVSNKRTRSVFSDQRAKDLSVKQLLSKLLIRIPISTVIIEEILFRGVVLALLLQHTTEFWAVLTSSVLFGLWHILPSLSASEFDNALNKKMGKASSLVSGTVLVTFLAGIIFAVLRIWTGSLLAPIMVHFSLNAAGFWGAWIAQNK